MDKYGIGGIHLTETTYPEFRRQLFLLLMQIDDGARRNRTLHDHIMSEADWLTNSKSRDDQGLFVE